MNVTVERPSYPLQPHVEVKCTLCQQPMWVPVGDERLPYGPFVCRFCGGPGGGQTAPRSPDGGEAGGSPGKAP